MKTFGLVFGLCAAVAACGGDNAPNRGGEGESCRGRDDCSGNLVCYNNVCSRTVGPVGPVDGGGSAAAVSLSGAGEACTKRADCAAGLRCFAGVCAVSEPAPVDAGPPAPTNPVLSDRGETCTRSEDCVAGLSCLPSSRGGLGICDIQKYNLTPGTSTCSAECKTATDCLELPLGLVITPIDGGPTDYNSCADLLKAMTPFSGSNCNGQDAISHECFLYKTYCDSANNPWTCTSGRCNYTKACDPTVQGEVMKGCPAKTRASNPVPSCNPVTKLCAAGAAGGCTMNDDCTDQGVADYPGQLCSPGECACVAATGSCYRKCNADLDCRFGYTCDPATSLCKPAGECTTDGYCAEKTGNVLAKCATVGTGPAKACKIPCRNDRDCSPSGAVGDAKFGGVVCGPDNTCAAMGCSSDIECSLAITDSDGRGLGSIKMFCAPASATTSVQYTSAITD